MIVLVQVVQGRCGVCVFGEIHEPHEHGLGEPALGGPS